MALRFAALSAVALLAGCSVEASVDTARDPLHKITDCTDTRDGERFSFEIAKARNIRVGYPNSCFDVVGMDGVDRTLCDGMEVYLKCVKRPPEAAK